MASRPVRSGGQACPRRRKKNGQQMCRVYLRPATFGRRSLAHIETQLRCYELRGAMSCRDSRVLLKNSCAYHLLPDRVLHPVFVIPGLAPGVSQISEYNVGRKVSYPPAINRSRLRSQRGAGVAKLVNAETSCAVESNHIQSGYVRSLRSDFRRTVRAGGVRTLGFYFGVSSFSTYAQPIRVRTLSAVSISA
jgi:hypothetical protein